MCGVLPLFADGLSLYSKRECGPKRVKPHIEAWKFMTLSGALVAARTARPTRAFFIARPEAGGPKGAERRKGPIHGSGVSGCDAHSYREPVDMGTTTMTKQDVKLLVTE